MKLQKLKKHYDHAIVFCCNKQTRLKKIIFMNAEIFNLRNNWDYYHNKHKSTTLGSAKCGSSHWDFFIKNNCF